MEIVIRFIKESYFLSPEQSHNSTSTLITPPCHEAFPGGLTSLSNSRILFLVRKYYHYSRYDEPSSCSWVIFIRWYFWNSGKKISYHTFSGFWGSNNQNLCFHFICHYTKSGQENLLILGCGWNSRWHFGDSFSRQKLRIQFQIVSHFKWRILC